MSYALKIPASINLFPFANNISTPISVKEYYKRKGGLMSMDGIAENIRQVFYEVADFVADSAINTECFLLAAGLFGKPQGQHLTLGDGSLVGHAGKLCDRQLAPGIPHRTLRA